MEQKRGLCSQGIEEEHHKPDERRNGLEEEAPPKEKEEEDRPKDKQKRKGVPPLKRGGRPRDPLSEHDKQIDQEVQQRRQRPEIVCWKRERMWIPALEVPEDLLENSNLSVSQNASPLTQDKSREACWRLNEPCGQVEVHWTEDDAPRETCIMLGKENLLIFKLSGQNQNQGRRINLPSSDGSYLVIVPENWDRDEALSGPPPVAPEPVSLTGYQAHFFMLEKGGSGKIAFRSVGNESIVIEPKASQLELVGVRLNDASEDMGPLFGIEPPKIRALDNRAWEGIGEIVVGEEGSGGAKWRRQFRIDPHVMEQAMPSEVAARRGGWYFLRIYDKKDDLLDSLDFRFLATLREIRIPPSSPIPSEGGHMPVKVELIHEPNCVLKAADKVAPGIQAKQEDNKSILTIPPNPACDRTYWRVGPHDGPLVEVVVLVERLWWAVGQEDNTPSDWEDKPLSLLREDFIATSKKALWLRLPRRRWVDRVIMGFEPTKGRTYVVRVEESMIARVLVKSCGNSLPVV